MILSDRDPFSPKDWHRYLNQNAFLLSNKLELGDIISALSAFDHGRAEDRAHVAETVRECPICGSWLIVLPVNVSPETQTGDDSKSVQVCRRCFYDHFSPLTVREILNGKID